jgi:hypothetical protein
VLLAVFGKLLSSKLGAPSRRDLSSTIFSPRIICLAVSYGTAAIFVEPMRPWDTMKCVTLPWSSITTSFTSPMLSPLADWTFLPIILEMRCLSPFFDRSPAAAVRVESLVEDDSSSPAVGLAVPDCVLSGDEVSLGEESEPEIGGVPVWLGLEVCGLEGV